MSGSNGFPGLLEDDDELVSEAQVRAHHDMAADDDDDESSAGALAENQLDQDDNEQVNFVGLEMPARNHNHGAHRNGGPNENLNNNMMMQMEQHSFAVNGGDGMVGNNNRSSGRRLQQRRHANGGAGEGMGGYLHRRNSGVSTSVSVSAPSVVTKSPCLTWSRIAPSSISGIVPHPRSGAASVIVRNKLYVMGGYGGGTGRLDDFHSFDFDTNTWEEVEVLSDERPGRRENNGVVIGGGTRLFLFGGYNGSAWLNDLWMFDIDTKRWECIQESSDATSEQQFEQQVIDAAAGNAFGQVSHPQNVADSGHARPSRRFGYVSVVHEGKFILFGGFDGTKWLNDMYEFDFKLKNWRQIDAKGVLPSVRSCPAWASNESQLFVQGGYDGVDRKADMYACDLTTYTWKEMPCLGTPPSPRYFHSCCLHGNKMFVYGGYSGSERLSDMYAYDFETNHWSEVDCSNGDMPSGRSSLVAQIYKNCMYIFGGYNGSCVLNDFFKFRLKAISVPSPRLVRDISKLINNPELSDVTFIVEGKQVYANRAILAVRSEYFLVMLNNGMRESMDKDAPIELEDVSYDIFMKVLEYLYTDDVLNTKCPTLAEALSLLVLSERFMLDRLKSLCEEIIRRDMVIENVIEIFIASHRHRALSLKDLALEFILSHLENPEIISGLTDLKAEPDLLVEIIKRNAITSSSVVTASEHPIH
mmetsp:Transcript_19665/g.25484  ORF Transcript_19665/g.25484 Transcript_19665/m.25484 type:complete len:699 (-) Transcript_19665:135-2231(-)|eukprot:CAMPEP_0116051574 /NCGR_PEP_ID=MMETSP0322-20121206/1059_1 /TAXON_ID=163516 /ORGANISM="Leptocylindrus danicus var. apora, Strain B651" /LENGTH=698 /DNA_ID=CAMNT_0003534345 /DNA_START=89 /DNA_END=2185 /DNA_ORIENTATION=+